MEVYQALISLLERDNNLVEQLLALGEQKQLSINQGSKVATIAQQEQTLIDQLQQVESQREELFDVIAPGLTLTEWLAQQSDANISSLTDTLRENLAKLQSLNEINKQLLQESLAFVQFSLNLLVDDTPSTYARQGTTRKSKSFFDRKV